MVVQNMHALIGEVGDVRDASVLLLAGPGNNGGDAVALARHLEGLGARVTLALVRPRGHYKGAAGFNARIAARLKLPMISTSEIKITCLIEEKYLELAVRTLHDAFGLDKGPARVC